MSEGTFAGTRGNDDNAPEAGIRRTSINREVREGFRMPARRERSTRVRGPASESPRRRNPRDSGGWPMGIWRGSGFGEGWFSQDRREMKAADDCALAAAAVLDGVIEDQPVRPCRRLQAPG